MDSQTPVRICVHFDSPDSVAFRLFHEVPGGSETEFATGSTLDGNPSCHNAGPFPPGTKIRWFMLISGNPDTAYRVRIMITQNGEPVGTPVTLTGNTDSDGNANEFGEVTL